MKHIVTLEEFLERLKEKHGDSIEYVSGFKNMRTKCMFRCKKDGHTWFATPTNIVNHKRGCPECAKRIRAEKRRTPIEKLIQKLKEVHGDDILYAGGFKNMNTKCWFFCTKCNELFYTYPSGIIYNGCGCPKCAIYKPTTPIEKVIELVDIVSNHTIEYVSGYTKIGAKCRWRCRICGYEWETTPNSILSGHGCKKCYVASRIIPLETIIKLVTELFDDTIEYVNGYIDSKTKCKWRCKVCGYEWEADPHALIQHHIGCRVCTMKRLHESMERPVYNALSKKSVLFKYDKALEGCFYNRENVIQKHPLRADFRLEKYPIILETDGRQHHFPMGGREAEIKEIQERDEIKNKWCKEHGYILIRVTSSPTHEWGTEKHITLKELLDLIEKCITEDGVVDIEAFQPYDFNRD